ncbi:MAG: 2-oxo acid dehydrogenase subunit E2 [Candidatus Eremiobacteraeota bacterium]|nr:2-oxo acid dehydrogenase subunit E2 [Candidatus Eremiobacteraeota bacterium]
MTNVIMPQMGESITEGTIVTWYKGLGEWVETDETLLLIATDKVDADVPSPASGYLSEICFPENETVPIDTVIARLSQENCATTKTADAPAPKKDEPAPEQQKQEKPVLQAVGASTGPTADSNIEELRKVRSSPLVRRMAAEHNVNISQVPGTGISGRVTKKDFLTYLEAQPAVSHTPAAAASVRKPVDAGKYAYQPVASDRIEPFSPMRTQIADHMVISRETSVHVTTVFEVDMTRIAKLRQKHKKRYEESGVKLSFMPFILNAVTRGISQFPVMNSAVVDRSIAYRQEVNLGMAVAVDWGLLVPVIRNADEKSLLGLARSVGDLAERARTRKLGPDDLQGGTFTVTNPGVFGSLFGTPIINQPQVAIMCVGTITKRPVVTEDDAIAIRHMMYLSLSFDHRVIDGATGDRFMKSVKDHLEQFPEELV